MSDLISRENVKMTLIFSKNTGTMTCGVLKKILEEIDSIPSAKTPERTAKVKAINYITCDNPLVRIVNSGYCECGALVFNDSRLKYCPQCGSRLEWE